MVATTASRVYHDESRSVLLEVRVVISCFKSRDVTFSPKARRLLDSEYCQKDRRAMVD